MKVLPLLFCFANVALSHIQMVNPIPRGSPKGSWPESQKDYNIMAPLGGADGKTYPCQGKQKGPITATWQAGQVIAVDFEPKTMHGGGHCQWSMSYDNEKTFVTFYTMLGNCLHPSNLPEYKIPLPPTLPACESCVMQWTWVNSIGNRELYANCADVTIKNDLPKSQQVYTNKAPLVIHVNNGIQKTIPEFPNPGMYDGRDLYDQTGSVSVGSGNGNGVNASSGQGVTSQVPVQPVQVPVQVPMVSSRSPDTFVAPQTTTTTTNATPLTSWGTFTSVGAASACTVIILLCVALLTK